MAERADDFVRQGSGWALHPSQHSHGRDLFVGAPTAARPQSAPGAAASTPLHRPPPVRARRPAWERPSMAAPSPNRLDVRHGQGLSLMPAAEPAAELSEGAGGVCVGMAMASAAEAEQEAAEMMIAPRRANLTASCGFTPPPGPVE